MRFPVCVSAGSLFCTVIVVTRARNSQNRLSRALFACCYKGGGELGLAFYSTFCFGLRPPFFISSISRKSEASGALDS